MLAALYCRLSKEDSDRIEKGGNSESIINQQRLLADYAKKHGFEIFDYYTDEDRSGLDRERPEFIRLINDAKEHLFDVVLCKTQSRFTRDMELVEKYIHGLFPVWGIRFISVVETYDTAVKGNKKARQISGLVNEWYCEDLSENIKAVLNKKMKDGEFIGSFACYGYKKSDCDRHALEIEEETARIVRDIFDMYIEGYSSRQIAGILQHRKILTPTAWKQSQGLLYRNPSAQLIRQETAKKSIEAYGKIDDNGNDICNDICRNDGNCQNYAWSAGTVKKILANETYIGTLVQGKERKISYKSRKVKAVPKEEWICVPNHHAAIISREKFWQAQSLRAARNNSPAKAVNP